MYNLISPDGKIMDKRVSGTGFLNTYVFINLVEINNPTTTELANTSNVLKRN